jgi:hypothetical protein
VREVWEEWHRYLKVRKLISKRVKKMVSLVLWWVLLFWSVSVTEVAVGHLGAVW